MRVCRIFGVLAVLMAPVGLAERGDAAPATCAQACYETKSLDYQRCRNIAPGNRAERVSCFQAADRRLASCLRSCPR